MHSRKHGKHGSKKPVKKIRPEWFVYDKEEIKKIILKLQKEGKSSSKIGIILRDQYGVPDARIFGLRITKVMERVDVPEDIYNLMVRVVNLHNHMNANKKDTKSKHGLELLESKVRRLGKYYVRTGILPTDWKYQLEKAKLLVK